MAAVRASAPRSPTRERRAATGSDLCFDEHPDRVERRADVVFALGVVHRVQEEREPRAFAVRRDLHPSPIAARRTPLDPALCVVGVERRLTVLIAAVVARIDLYTIMSRRTRGRPGEQTQPLVVSVARMRDVIPLLLGISFCSL